MKKIFGIGLIVAACFVMLSAVNIPARDNHQGANRHEGRGGGYHGYPGHFYEGYRHHGFYPGYGWGDWPFWSVGFYINSLPGDDCYPVIVNGFTYYCCDGYYFSPSNNGYVLVNEPIATPAPVASVAPPVTAAQPQPVSKAQINLGMSQRDVMLAVGVPDSAIKSTTTYSGTRINWYYSNQIVTFSVDSNSKVISITIPFKILAPDSSKTLNKK
jgi:hypothetical protein